MRERTDYDAIIVGGGLVGLTAALALSGPANRTGLKVALIDARDPAKSRDGAFDGRASAITATSGKMLQVLGVWQTLEARAQAINEIVVTDSALSAASRPALLHFGDSSPSGRPSAYMVENRHLFRALYDAAAGMKNLDIHANMTVLGYDFSPSGARVALSSGQSLSAHLVIAADGALSRARQAAGIKTIGWSYAQAAITATIAHECPHNGRAFEHFLPAGPFAVLPLTGNRSSLVWTESAREAERIAGLDSAGFTSELGRRLDDRLGARTLAGAWQCRPLSMSLAQSFIAERLALIGDAAHVIHPIAGLGFNLGLRDVAALAEAVIERVRLGFDPGEAQALRAYESWRRFDTIKTVIATDGLNRLFSNDTPALRAIRDAGLAAVNQLVPVRSEFMRQAAGADGRLPKMLAGQPI